MDQVKRIYQRRGAATNRGFVLRFLVLDVHSRRMPVPFTSFIQGPKLRNKQGSQNSVNADMLDSHNSSYPQPAILIRIDLQKSLSYLENVTFTSASAQTVTDYRSSASNVLEQPHRLAKNKSSKNKPAKSSRKKGKKKRKQHKSSMHKMATIKPENQGEEVNCDASKSEASAGGDLVCSAASENNLSLVVACPSLPVQDASSEAADQLNIECNGKDCSGRSSSSVGEPLDKSINDSRKPASLPYEFTDDDIDKMPFEVVTSSSNQSCEMSLSTTLQNNPEIDMTEDSLDVRGTQWSIANDGGFNPLADRMTFASRNVSVQGECEEYSHQDDDLSSRCCVNFCDWQKDVADTGCSSERRLGSSSQASSSDDFHPVIRTKRGRLARKFSGNENGMHRLNNAHLNQCFETDNKHSMWQKVEKASTLELTCPRNNEKIASRNVDISLNSMETRIRQLSQLKQNRSGKSFSTYPEKLQRKPNLAFERESRSARHTSKNNVNIPSKIQVLRRENLGTSVEFTNTSQLTDRINYSLRSTKNSQKSLQKATRPDNICSILHNTSSMSQEIPANASVIASNSSHGYADTQFHSTTQLSVDMNNDPCICTSKEDNQSKRVEMERAHLENSRTDNSSGPLLQKCLPTGIQDIVITRSQMDDQAGSNVNDPVPSSLNSSITDEFSSSNLHSFVCLSTREIQCSSLSSGYMNCSSPQADELIRKPSSQPCTSSEESYDFPTPSGCHFSHETKEQLIPGFETNLTKIIKAADESYKLLAAAEGIQMATGSPLAGFERLLHSASPLIETDCISICNTCSQNQIIGDSLCSHQVPNILLRRLWQWYEKPGSYGLEVKVDNVYTSKRSRTGLSKFCAYFVPYLSALQLFALSGKSIYHPNNDTEGDLMKPCEVCETSKYSTNLASLPIFLKLLPQPSKKEDTGSTKLASSGKSEEFNKPIFKEQLADDLLFEYFDSDQPQQRRPLFDKIQELIRGNSSSNCHFFGDPSKLGCLNLKELHPASWYAVAWYPIYRIPDGSFRAAFLTYHSFGHFVHKSTSNSTEGCINSLISPVVGLQSYNAKGECWFEPTNLNSRALQTDASMPECPSENFKNRLQSLERTAYVMSRATIRKGNLNCSNRHPDFEFFLSRRR